MYNLRMKKSPTVKCNQCGKVYSSKRYCRVFCAECGLHYCGICETWMARKDFIGEWQNMGANCADCRSKTRFAEGWLKLRFNVLKRDNFTCQYCGRSAPNVSLVVDHIFPFSKGGKNTIENLRTACSDCNFGKNVSVF